MKFLVNLFFFFSLLPFLSPVPIQTDVQPPVFVIATLIMLIDLPKRRLRISRTELMFLVVALFSLAYLSIEGEYEIVKRLGLLMAFTVFYVAKRYSHLFSSRILTLAIGVNLIGGILQIIAPDVFSAIANHLVRMIKITTFEYRGISGFAAEPGFLGATAVTYLVILWYFFDHCRISKREFIFGVTASLLLLVLSKSGTGYVLFLFLVLIYLIFKISNWKRFIVYVTVCAIFLITISGLIDKIIGGRGSQVVKAILSNPEYIFKDSSIASRVVNIHIGVLSVFYHPLGLGGGGYKVIASKLFSTHAIADVYPNVEMKYLEANVSALGQYLAELGLIFVIFLSVVIAGALYRELFSVQAVILASMFIFASFSIVFPLTWLLLAVASREKMIWRHMRSIPHHR